MSNTTNTTATTKKPYELKAERNREILHTFFEANPEYRTLISALLSFTPDSKEKEIGSIDICIGRRTKNGFNVMLQSYTDKPDVRRGNWNNIEPTMCIGTTERKTHNILCSLNLSLISDLKTELQATEKYDKYVFTFRYDGVIDYQITVIHTVVTTYSILQYIAV